MHKGNATLTLSWDWPANRSGYLEIFSINFNRINRLIEHCRRKEWLSAIDGTGYLWPVAGLPEPRTGISSSLSPA